MRDQNYLLSVKHKIFPQGVLTDEYHDNFDDQGEAISAYECAVASTLTIQARLIETESGQMLRRYCC